MRTRLLIPQHKLTLALTDWTYRNDLIEQLSKDLPAEVILDSYPFYQNMLMLLLSSDIARAPVTREDDDKSFVTLQCSYNNFKRIKRLFKKNRSYPYCNLSSIMSHPDVHRGNFQQLPLRLSDIELINNYLLARQIPPVRAIKRSYKSVNKIWYCLLTLEKYKSVFAETSSSYQHLHRVSSDILHYFNKNYTQLIWYPGRLQQACLNILQQLTTDDKLLTKCKKICIQQINTHEPHPALLDKLNQNDMTLRLNILKFITVSHSFLHTNTSDLRDTCRPIIIPAQDGTLLNGTYVAKKNSFDDTVIITLLGHFAAEHSYVSGGYQGLRDLLGMPIVFINHRNFSPYASHYSPDEKTLAEDIVDFVKYFIKKKKKIILYGMCGGVAQMLLATERLKEEKIPFRIIIDRFSQSYDNMLDFKSERRLMELEWRQRTDYKQFISNLFLLFAMFTIVYFIKMLVKIASIRMDFSALAKKIPDEDILIFQGKGPKNPDIAACDIDEVVHPENDMRAAFKDRRKTKKVIFKHLKDCAQQLQEMTVDLSLKNIFQGLALAFDQCINLISDEKLRPITTSTSMTYIHSHYLYYLTTRSHKHLGFFVEGFIKASTIDATHPIHKLIAYSEFEIICATLETVDNHQYSSILAGFLSMLVKHKALIVYFYNRISVEKKLPSLSHRLFGDLLDTELFQSLDSRRNHLSVAANQ